MMKMKKKNVSSSLSSPEGELHQRQRRISEISLVQDTRVQELQDMFFWGEGGDLGEKTLQEFKVLRKVIARSGETNVLTPMVSLFERISLPSPSPLVLFLLPGSLEGVCRLERKTEFFDTCQSSYVIQDVT